MSAKDDLTNLLLLHEDLARVGVLLDSLDASAVVDVLLADPETVIAALGGERIRFRQGYLNLLADTYAVVFPTEAAAFGEVPVVSEESL